MEASILRPFKASVIRQSNFTPCRAFIFQGRTQKVSGIELIGGNILNKTKLIVTRVFDSRRTPQDAFVRAILNSENADKAEKCLQEVGCEGIIENEEPLCSSPASFGKGEANG